MITYHLLNDKGTNTNAKVKKIMKAITNEFYNINKQIIYALRGKISFYFTTDLILK